MKKVININFQGRVIPIEETAYDILKQYVESLRRFFANEEGRDEIINDIEGRIAELFSETLKKGSTCITDDDVNTIIASMGRPEDFDAEETKVQSQLGGESRQENSSGYQKTESVPRGRLYRDESDKLLGGVCAGLANYLRMDPTIVRILFAIITFGGFGAGFLIYILLWIILPSRSLETNIRKRLYRNPDDKVIGGVASGIGAYFNIAVWIPRLIFALPLLLGIIVSIFRNVFSGFDPFPSIVFGSFGSSLFIIYIVLWAVIPQANTASEKLEMRGEKVDLNTIRNTIQEDIDSLKGRAQKFGGEVKERAEKWSNEIKDRGRSFAAETSPVVKKTGSRLGNAIGIIFKGFFLLIAGVIAFALLMGMLGVMIGGVSVFPLKSFFLTGFWQNFFAWSTLLLFLAVPVIALLVWLIRRLIGVKSKNSYLGYIFGGLWFIGLVSAILLALSIANSFRTRAGVEENVNITQPQINKLYVKVSPYSNVSYFGSDWYGIHWDHDAPFYGLTEDSLMMRTIQVKIVKSDDSIYHVNMIKFSRGNDPETARQLASKISFHVDQNDSTLVLPKGFTITKNEKFRNQQVLLLVKVPVGKKIELDRSVNDYKWFNIESDYDHNWNNDWNDEWQNSYGWSSNVEYIMTDNGLKATHPTEDEKIQEDQSTQDKQQQLDDIQKQKKELEEKQQELEKSLKEDTNHYRYQPETPQQPKADSTKKGEAKVSVLTKKSDESINIHDLAFTVIGRS
jgi:phage shock protein PspC (stress-responsive transcriptional regulator)